LEFPLVWVVETAGGPARWSG